MKPRKAYHVYIMSNKHDTCLYTGVTGSLFQRIMQHKSGEGGKFTQMYKCHKLVYFEETSEPLVAIVREKEIKGWSRKKKNQLIDRMNPQRKDLFEELTTDN